MVTCPIVEFAVQPRRVNSPQCSPARWAWGAYTRGDSSGESHQVGCRVAKERVDLHDLHATILHLLGLDHTRLTYRYNGRDFRLTDVAGEVIKPILA